MQLLDTMMTVFGFIGIGVLCSIVYAIRLKVPNHLKPPPFFFLSPTFWTLPDIVHLATGGSLHPPIPIMILSLIGIGILFYASQKGEVASAE